MKNNIREDFVDEKGNKAEIIITSNDNEHVNLKPNYKLQRPDSDNKYMQKDAKAKASKDPDEDSALYKKLAKRAKRYYQTQDGKQINK